MTASPKCRAASSMTFASGSACIVRPSHPTDHRLSTRASALFPYWRLAAKPNVGRVRRHNSCADIGLQTSVLGPSRWCREQDPYERAWKSARLAVPCMRRIYPLRMKRCITCHANVAPRKRTGQSDGGWLGRRRSTTTARSGPTTEPTEPREVIPCDVQLLRAYSRPKPYALYQPEEIRGSVPTLQETRRETNCRWTARGSTSTAWARAVWRPATVLSMQNDSLRDALATRHGETLARSQCILERTARRNQRISQRRTRT